mmetsp:Transcript_13883/g.39510  ORF Transcript_13883/g.39510 Transcript_13883/m.39510 type:complete len:187 (+) Transcript_13883:168-728(+)
MPLRLDHRAELPHCLFGLELGGRLCFGVMCGAVCGSADWACAIRVGLRIAGACGLGVLAGRAARARRGVRAAGAAAPGLRGPGSFRVGCVVGTCRPATDGLCTGGRVAGTRVPDAAGLRRHRHVAGTPCAGSIGVGTVGVCAAAVGLRGGSSVGSARRSAGSGHAVGTVCPAALGLRGVGSIGSAR